MCFVKMSEKHEITMQKTSCYKKRSSSPTKKTSFCTKRNSSPAPEPATSQKPAEVDEKLENLSQTITNVVQDSVSDGANNSKNPTTKLNFVQRNKCLVGMYNKKRYQGNCQERKSEGKKSGLPLQLERRHGREDAPCTTREAGNGSVSKLGRVREGRRKMETTLREETRRVLDALQVLNEPLQPDNIQ